MVIAFLTPSMNGGGAERVISALANSFSVTDEVYILELGNEDSAYYLENKVTLIRLDVAKKSKNIVDTINSFNRHKQSIRRKIYEIKADIIISFTVRLAFIAKQAVGKSVKVIGSERGNPFLVRRKPVDQYIRRKSPIIDGCIFQTISASKYYPEKLRKKSIVIPNGIFLKVPERLPKYSVRENVIVTTGNLRKLKRHDLIIEAFADFHKKFPKYELHIYGEGDTHDLLIDDIKHRGLEDSVFLKGYCDNLADVMINCKIFILASDYEGMPNGLIEAMACGCACISTNCNFGPSELITNIQNGILVKTGESQGIYEALMSIASDDSLGGKLSENAKKINESHSPEIIINKYHKYIENIKEL